MTPANHDWEKAVVCFAMERLSVADIFEVPPPNQAPSTTLLPGAAQAVTSGASSLDSYTFIHNQDVIPPPSQPWPNKPSLAVPIEQSLSLINNFDAPPLTYDQSPGTSILYDDVLSGVEGHNNDGDGLIHPEENDKRWAHGFFGSSKERDHEKDAFNELVRLVGGCWPFWY